MINFDQFNQFRVKTICFFFKCQCLTPKICVYAGRFRSTKVCAIAVSGVSPIKCKCQTILLCRLVIKLLTEFYELLITLFFTTHAALEDHRGLFYISVGHGQLQLYQFIHMKDSLFEILFLFVNVLSISKQYLKAIKLQTKLSNYQFFNLNICKLT